MEAWGNSTAFSSTFSGLDPTTVKDLRRTPTKVSLQSVVSLQRTGLAEDNTTSWANAMLHSIDLVHI
jgi:hypothetical protein